MTHAERLKFSRETARASSERDRAIERLGLSSGQRLPWEGLFGAEPGFPALSGPQEPDAAVLSEIDEAIESLR